MSAGVTAETPKVSPSSTTAKEDKSSDSVDVYAYSMLAPASDGGVIIYARIVFDSVAQACPSLAGSDGSKLSTSLRPLYPGATRTAASFPVTVCESVLAEGISYSNDTYDIGIDAVTLKPSHIQVYGDTGCKDPSDCPGDDPSPKFQDLTTLSADNKADLILHMGDLNYRGTYGAITEVPDPNGNTTKIHAYDAGDGSDESSCGLATTYYSQNAFQSPRPDVWSKWKSDFFDSAEKLLSKAPWVFARGNHELCSRAGPGWFYFVGPGSSLSGGITQQQCPDQGDFNSATADAIDHIIMIEPYMLRFAGWQLWVMDTANACDAYATNSLTKQYQAQYEKLQHSAGDKLIWMMTHRPIWGYQKTDEPTLNQMLQTALYNTGSKALPSSVGLSLAGHMHVYESLTFASPGTRPPQIVVGNSGVSLSSHPKSSYFNSPVSVDREKAQGNTLEDQTHGYLQVKLEDNGSWIAKMHSPKDHIILHCDSTNPAHGDTICE
jgi:hypothetical protein